MVRLGLTRFHGHPRSGARHRRGCPVHHGDHGQEERPGARRSFTPEIVAACKRGDRSIGQGSADFDLTETAVREWVKQAEIDAGERDGLTTAEREELSRLRRENRRLAEDVEILKRATALFAKETQ